MTTFQSFKIAIFVSLFAVSVTGYGQDEKADRKLTVDLGADLVSSYVWRGLYQIGPSFQPTLSLSAYGLTVGAWGSTDFSTFAKELDFYLSYEIKGFTAGIADYWWSGEGASYFRNGCSHHVEANVGFTFGEKFPLSLQVNTMLAGEEDQDDAGRRYYSTYVSASYPFSVKYVDCEAGIGVSPWKGMYGNKFDVAAITVRVSKNLQLSAKYAIPVFVELIISPAQDNTFLVFGVRF